MAAKSLGNPLDQPNESVLKPIESYRHACGREYIPSDFATNDERMCQRCETLVKNPWKKEPTKEDVLPAPPKPNNPIPKPPKRRSVPPSKEN